LAYFSTLCGGKPLSSQSLFVLLVDKENLLYQEIRLTKKIFEDLALFILGINGNFDI
jgi:hypothetical protein